MLNNKRAAQGVINLYRSTKSSLRRLIYPKRFRFNSFKESKYDLVYDTALDYHSWKHFKEEKHGQENIKLLILFIGSVMISTFAFTLRYNQVQAYTYYIMYPIPMKYFDILCDDIAKSRFWSLIPQNRYEIDGFWQRKWQEISGKKERQKKRDQRAIQLKQELMNPSLKYQ